MKDLAIVFFGPVNDCELHKGLGLGKREALL